MSLLSWLKGLRKREDDGPLPEGGIDALRADQEATLRYGIPPDQAERISRRDAEELERAEDEQQ
jgi:hypothetical protein